MPEAHRTVLILGGTGEAAQLAARLSAQPGLRVITSLAGRTENPSVTAGERRIGGFGGSDGLARYLCDERIDVLVDATHPFAENMSMHAEAAAQRTGTRLFTLTRPAWKRSKEDRWTVVRSLREAASALPAKARVFLALGSQHLAAFAVRKDVHFIVRMVDFPADLLNLISFNIIAGMPGKTAEEEMALFERLGVDVLVSRNSGGPGAYAKIEAARRLSLPVIMIERPKNVAGDAFCDMEALVAAIG